MTKVYQGYDVSHPLAGLLLVLYGSRAMHDVSRYTHIFFDLDDTLTATRTPMDEDMRTLVHTIERDLIAVSGADFDQMSRQLLDTPFYKLTQNGNHAFDRDGNELWKNLLTEEEKHDVYRHMSQILALSPYDVKDESDLIEDRKSQIALSLIGHHEDLDKKKAYDPTGSVRAELMARAPFMSDLMDVRIAGTATLDYTKKNSNKGTNIARLLREKGWHPTECVYLGDKLMPGGNDETVIGVIDTIPVVSHRDTYEILKHSFPNSGHSDDIRAKILAALNE